jgi:enoyl-CoA hydratase/carnithine racemase
MQKDPNLYSVVILLRANHTIKAVVVHAATKAFCDGFCRQFNHGNAKLKAIRVATYS